MLTDLTRRLGVVLGSVVTLVTALAAIVATFIDEVVPALPDGWQDNAVQIGGVAVAVLLSAAAAIRRVTEVPAAQRGILPTKLASGGRITGPPSGSVHLHIEGGTPTVDAIVNEVRRAGRPRL